MTSRSSKMAAATRVLAALLPVLSAVSCTVGPDYRRPAAPVPDAFRAQVGPADARSIADLPWWGVFGDPALQALITEGLADNYDLKIAVARIEQARAQVQIVNSQALPQIGYQVFAEGEKAVVPLEARRGSLTFNTFGGLLTAAWEADVWGRIRRATEAAKADLLAQEYVRRGVMLTLVSDLAGDYFRLLELDRELAIAEESSAVYRRTLDLFDLRYQAGRDAKLAVERARADYNLSLSNIAALKQQIGQLEDAISVLAGAYPRAILRGRALVDQVTPATPVSATTALLERRPDILQAEQAMVSANAQIGVAVADYFPKVGLSAFFGEQGLSVGHSTHGFSVWNYALDVTGPIFTGGRLQGAYDQRRAYWDETIAQYKKTVLTAFRETSDALIAQQNLVRQRSALEQRVLSLRQSLDLALTRYDAGRASYFEVLEAEQQLFPAQAALAQTQRDQLLAVVNLYKALGGGWSLADAQWTQPH